MVILQMLFLEPQTPDNIKKVAAFFYGNGVPVDLAFQLYEACSTVSRTGVMKEVRELYEWFATVEDGCGKCLETYYNIRYRKSMYVQGPRMGQLELVVPKPRMLFSFGRMLTMVERKLEHVRRVRVFCGVDFCGGRQCGGDCKCDCRSCVVRRHDLEFGCKCKVLRRHVVIK